MFVNHLKHVFLSAIHKKSSQMLKLIDWFCFCNTDFRTCFKFIVSHFKTESCLQLCCITSSFSSNLFNELERQRRPTLVAFIATCLRSTLSCLMSDFSSSKMCGLLYCIFCFTMHQFFSVGDRSELQAFPYWFSASSLVVKNFSGVS